MTDKGKYHNLVFTVKLITGEELEDYKVIVDGEQQSPPYNVMEGHHSIQVKGDLFNSDVKKVNITKDMDIGFIVEQKTQRITPSPTQRELAQITDEKLAEAVSMLHGLKADKATSSKLVLIDRNNNEVEITIEESDNDFVNHNHKYSYNTIIHDDSDGYKHEDDEVVVHDRSRQYHSPRRMVNDIRDDLDNVF